MNFICPICSKPWKSAKEGCDWRTSIKFPICKKCFAPAVEGEQE